MNCLISIIVPVYNEENFLYECIESILSQTYENIEVIIIDDGSTNNAKIDCDIISARDSRIKVIHQYNQGLSSARVNGLKVSNGEWVMFVDNDDIISPYCVEKLLANYDDDVDIIAGGRLDLIEPRYDWSRKSNEIYKKTGPEICSMIGDDKQKSIITPLWGKLYRKEFLDSINVYQYKTICPTIYFEDVLMTPILYYKARKIVIVKEALYIHRIVQNSISNSRKINSFYLEQIDSERILLNFFKAYSIKRMYSYELAKCYRTMLRLWCLIDEANISSFDIDMYKHKIISQYKYYFSDYIRLGNDSLMKKIYYSIFFINKDLWKKITLNLYFKKKSANYVGRKK